MGPLRTYRHGEDRGALGTAGFPVHPNLRFAPMNPIFHSAQKQGDRKAP